MELVDGMILGCIMSAICGLLVGWAISYAAYKQNFDDMADQRDQWHDKYMTLVERENDTWWREGKTAPFLREEPYVQLDDGEEEDLS